MVPSGWEVKKLEDLCAPDAPITYGVLKPGEYCSKGIPLLQIKDLSNGQVSSQDLHLISKELDEEYKRSRILKNDILISLVGTIGRVAKFELSTPANIHRNLGRVRTDYHEFIFHFLNSDVALKLMGDSSSGSSQSALNLSTLRAMKVPFPPFKEQQKIAQILSTWQQAILVTEKLLENSQQQRKALMQQLLTGGKRLLASDGFPFLDEWKAYEIGSLLKEVKRPVNWCDESDYQLLSVKRRSEGVILRETLKGDEILTKKMNIAFEGDFLISKMQIVHGATGLVTKKFHGCHISDSYIALVPKDKSKIDIEFFTWFSKQKFMYWKAFFCSYGVHIEKMTFNFNLYLKEKIKIPSSIEEQNKIVSVLSSADQEIETLQKKLDCLKQEKKALMQQLLTGKKRVKVAA